MPRSVFNSERQTAWLSTSSPVAAPLAENGTEKALAGNTHAECAVHKAFKLNR